jgi:hypothetical protein
VIAAMPGTYPAERCTWCGADVGFDDGFRAYEPAGERRAAFCRLEHLVPWQIQGAIWEAGEAPPLDDAPSRCSLCDAELGDVRILLVRHRGEHRIADGFCTVEHMADWAKAGGRWR